MPAPTNPLNDYVREVEHLIREIMMEYEFARTPGQNSPHRFDYLLGVIAARCAGVQPPFVPGDHAIAKGYVHSCNRDYCGVQKERVITVTRAHYCPTRQVRIWGIEIEGIGPDNGPIIFPADQFELVAPT